MIVNLSGHGRCTVTLAEVDDSEPAMANPLMLHAPHCGWRKVIAVHDQGGVEISRELDQLELDAIEWQTAKDAT